MTASTGPLEHLVDKAGQLYSLPAVAMEVLELTDSPTVDVPGLKACIENDPALTTKVLRVVNSSLFGLSREVCDLSQALSLLGTKPLKLLVLGFSLPERLFDGVGAEILGWYWRNTLTKAVAAREIAGVLGGHSGDEAFIAGLLQDLGILLLIQEVGEPYLQFLQRARDRGSDLTTLEAALLGFDHTEMTSRLLGRWGLPRALIDAVRRPEPPPGASTPSGPALGEIVHWAGLVARLVSEAQTDVLGELLGLEEASQRLSPEQLDRLVAELGEKVEQLADVLSLRLPAGRDYHDVLVEAHLQLAQVAAEVAGDLVVRQESPRALESERRAFEHEFRSLSDAVAQISGPPSASEEPETPSGPASEPDVARSRPPGAARSAVPSAAGTYPGHASSAPPADGHRVAASRSAAAELDPELARRLDAAVSECRRLQCALTLLLVELDDVERLKISFTAEGFRKLCGFLEKTCGGVDHPGAVCLPYGDHGFAVLLPDGDRQPAVRLAGELIDRVRRVMAGGPSRGRSVLSISVGAATVSIPSRNFRPEGLVEGAQRCLHASQASGGGVVKSIEIY
jgi:HD-like signal output (HDOD) protein/GGDEF domain-containing protein